MREVWLVCRALGCWISRALSGESDKPFAASSVGKVEGWETPAQQCGIGGFPADGGAWIGAGVGGEGRVGLGGGWGRNGGRKGEDLGWVRQEGRGTAAD